MVNHYMVAARMVSERSGLHSTERHESRLPACKRFHARHVWFGALRWLLLSMETTTSQASPERARRRIA